MATPRAERLAQIISYLGTRSSPVTAATLARRFGVTERTLYHDISTLRAEGAQIKGAPARGGGLSLDATAPGAAPSVPSRERLARAFVGREQELAELTLALDHALDGRGSVVLLAGEPGMGKTRTLHELEARAGKIGVVSVWGRCHERDGAPPFWPWIGVLRPLIESQSSADELRHALGAGAPVIAEMIPEIRARLPDLPAAPAGADMSSARFRLFDAVLKFLTSVAAARPLILALDDLQWADEPSLMMLEFIASEATDARILIVGTYRTDELSRRRPFLNTLAELTRSGICQTISLRGLSRSDVELFVTW